jgi:hypothetical protein
MKQYGNEVSKEGYRETKGIREKVPWSGMVRDSSDGTPMLYIYACTTRVTSRLVDSHQDNLYLL